MMRGISIKGYRGFRPPPEDLIYSDLSVLKPWIFVCFVALP